MDTMEYVLNVHDKAGNHAVYFTYKDQVAALFSEETVRVA
jgi:hypothetical protein